MTTGSMKHAKFQSNGHQQQTNTKLFTGRMPFLSPNRECQRTDNGFMSDFRPPKTSADMCVMHDTYIDPQPPGSTQLHTLVCSCVDPGLDP